MNKEIYQKAFLDNLELALGLTLQMTYQGILAYAAMIKGVLKGDKVVVDGGEELEERGYGRREGGNLVLSLIEAAYLVDKGDLEVVSEDGAVLSFEELIRMAAINDSSFWVKLLVYSDLRYRGLRARPLESAFPAFLVEKKVREGEKRYLVLCLEEGARIGFKDVEAYLRRAMEARRELVFAIVDKEGNISYYRVEKVMGA